MVNMFELLLSSLFLNTRLLTAPAAISVAPILLALKLAFHISILTQLQSHPHVDFLHIIHLSVSPYLN